MVDPRVSLLIVALLLAVLQVAVYVHVRNVVTASAQEGARFAANADVELRVGGGAHGGGGRPRDLAPDRRGPVVHVGRGGRGQRAHPRGRPLRARFLEAAVAAGLDMLVAGGTPAGRTTLQIQLVASGRCVLRSPRSGRELRAGPFVRKPGKHLVPLLDRHVAVEQRAARCQPRVELPVP